eukprot:scaffold981_cov119-Cylindrotheca_fusiformis.AAC.4
MKFILIHVSFFQLCLLEIQCFSYFAPISKPSSLDASESAQIVESYRPRASDSPPAVLLDDAVELYSLKWTPDDCISIPVRKVWKWKDSVLGDGRDFFVPKPKTIQRLQTILLNQLPELQECSVLSNCARLEILCVWEGHEESSTEITERRLKNLSTCLLHQVDFCDDRRKNQFFVSLMTQSFDNPNVLSLEAHIRNKDPDALELSRHWDVYAGLSDILLHLCQISAGMASRPRRPDRQVIFRPFSSRDAHILLQLKRTKELVSPKKNGLLNQLLEYTIRAGKASRNEKQVPELSKLKGYGDGSSKYSSSDPPLQLSEEIRKVVLEQAIRPLIQECIDKVEIAHRKELISKLRQTAEGMASSQEETTLIRKLLHQPTMDLRNNPTVFDMDRALGNIEAVLLKFRNND